MKDFSSGTAVLVAHSMHGKKITIWVLYSILRNLTSIRITDMICIIAGNYREAETWARGQMLADNEWFYPFDKKDLYGRQNFHVVVIGTAGQNVPPKYFEEIYAI